MVASSRGLAVVFAALVAHASLARADSPWAEGVTDEQKTKAKTLLDSGNQLLLEKKYVEALAEYAEAVAVWDHPAIRFNMVRCEIQLGKNLEAYGDLEKSLKYGAAPLEETVYNEALAYQKLLESQVGELAYSCDQQDVALTLDGKALAACPTKQTMRVLAGAHQIVGTKKGLLTRTEQVVVAGGKPQSIDIHLDPLAKGARIEHRWASYIPWTVFFGGLGVAAIGTTFQLLGTSEMHEYDRWVNNRCASLCTPAELADVKHLHDGAQLKSTVGVSLMITGGAAVAAGAVMLYLNRGRTVYPEIVPAPGGATVGASGRF